MAPPLLLFLFLLSCTRCLPITVHCTGEANRFAYNGFTDAKLAVDDTAFVTSDGLLILTNGTNRLKGHATHSSLLQFHNKSAGSTHVLSSFSSTFVFAILSEYTDLSGHGLALFIAPTKNFSDALSYEYLGLFNMENNGNASNHVFAVELDTVRNLNFGDIDSNHVGIDVNGLNSTAAASAGYHDDEDNSTFRGLTMMSGEVIQVWVDYDAARAELNVTLAPVEVPNKPKKPLLQHHVNLSTVITEWAYVGFSSSLGDMSSRHCILGWSFSLDGPATPLSYTKLPKLPVVRRRSKNELRMALRIVLPIVMFTLAMVAAIFLLVRRHHKYAELQEGWEEEFTPHRFSYKDLFRATNGFSDARLLGVGGFGKVYKGTLPGNNLEIAVKKVSHDSKQGIKEFISEIVTIGRLEHKNLVRLLGYCRRRHDELLLVYEYLSNGSLDRYLHSNEMNCTLDWDTRFHIIKGVSLGLSYLHDNCEKVIIHRDIKASNILLDDEMNGRLGDFGLARLHDHGTDPQTTHVVGTIGYLAPELARTSKATPLTDVFAFGMFLLEVACGRRPIILDRQDTVCWLVDWVLENWDRGDLIGSMDKRLGGNYDIDQACLVLKVGLLCSRPSPCSRPVMRQVVQYLEGSMPLPDVSPTSPNFGTLALLQTDGFEAYAMPYYTVSSSASCILESVLSSGR